MSAPSRRDAFASERESLAFTDQVERTVAPAIRAEPYVWRDPRTFPRRQWLYGFHLVRKFLSCTFAQSGIGKSSLVLVEAVAMATGRALLGIAPRGGPLRVWYWNGEDPLEEVERRVAAILLHFDVDPAELGDRLFLNSGRDCRIVLATMERGGTLVAEPVVEAMTATIKANAIDVTILDPFVSTHAVDENLNVPVSIVCAAWARIADVTETAIELVHHTRKNGGAEVTLEDARGAGSMNGASRSSRVLNVMTDREAREAGVDKRGYFRTTNGKASMAPPSNASDWFRLVSVPLGNGINDYDEGDKVGVVTRFQWPDPLAEVTVDKLRKVQAAVETGRWRANAQAAQWVGKAVADVLGFDISIEADKSKVKRLIQIWLKNGALVTVEGEDEKRNKRSFVEVGERATNP